MPTLVAKMAAGSGRMSLTAVALVLVVAPDRDFRRSLEFALETEGFRVEPHASIFQAAASAGALRARCIVVDDAAMAACPGAEDEFRRFAQPVIFLAGGIGPLAGHPFAAILTKPFLGNPLIEAVREIVAPGI